MRRDRGKGPLRYAVVIEGGVENGYSAYVPDLPECVATGRTVGEVQHAMRMVVDRYMRKMGEGGLAVPAPTRQVAYVEVVPISA